MIAILRLSLTAAAMFTALCACSNPESEVKPKSAVDMSAWRAELVTAGATPDMDKMYDVTVKDCEAKVDDLAFRFTLVGARPDLQRISMKYVCPGRAGRVDEALRQMQDATKTVREACALPPSARTEQQQLMAEADGCK